MVRVRQSQYRLLIVTADGARIGVEGPKRMLASVFHEWNSGSMDMIDVRGTWLGKECWIKVRSGLVVSMEFMELTEEDAEHDYEDA